MTKSDNAEADSDDGGSYCIAGDCSLISYSPLSFPIAQVMLMRTSEQHHFVGNDRVVDYPIKYQCFKNPALLQQSKFVKQFVNLVNLSKTIKQIVLIVKRTALSDF